MRPTIAAVVMAYNEAEILPLTLPVISEVVDQVVVVDMGSSDGSDKLYPELLRRDRDLVVSFPRHFLFCSGFGHARNYGAGFCETDWILAIDSDEYLEPAEFTQALEGALDRPEIIGVERRNYVAEPGLSLEDVPGIIKNAPFESEVQRRLYPATPDFSWRGLVHEEIRIRNRPVYEARSIGATIHHLNLYKKTLDPYDKQEMYAYLLLKGFRYPGFRLGTNPWFYSDYIPSILQQLVWQANTFAGRYGLQPYDFEELRTRLDAVAPGSSPTTPAP